MFSKIIVLLLLIGSFEKDCLARNILNGRRILLNGYATKKLLTDKPFSDFHLSKKENKIWLLGKTSLWLQNINQKNSLKRIRIVRAKKIRRNEYLQQFVSNNNVIYIASETKLYRLKNKIELVKIAKFKKIKKLYKHNNNIYVYIDHSIYRIEAESNKLVKITNNAKINISTELFVEFEENFLWYTKNKTLYKKSFIKNKSSIKVYKSRYKLKILEKTKKYLILKTQFAILFVSKSGKLLKSVPIGKKRKLIGQQFTDSLHYYLFSDGLLQKYDIFNKNLVDYQILFGKNIKSIKKIQIKNDLLSYIYENFILTFKLSKK